MDIEEISLYELEGPIKEAIHDLSEKYNKLSKKFTDIKMEIKCECTEYHEYDDNCSCLPTFIISGKKIKKNKIGILCQK